MLYVIIPHEILHKEPHFLKDVGRSENNIMNCAQTNGVLPQKPLRVFEIQPVKTGCGSPEGIKESQWIKIKRNENQK
jgi:hypothetical protein